MKSCVLVVTLLLGGCSTSALSNIDTNTTKASWYSQGAKTASGARFNPKSLTAAHRNLPFGTLIKVTNLDNNKTIVVMINDRGPFIKGRGLDVSKQAAIELGFLKKGVTTVTYQKIK
jgi:rare lipoprotein A